MHESGPDRRTDRSQQKHACTDRERDCQSLSCVLGKVTSGLRIEFQELIQPPREDCLLVTPQELLPTKELEGQYRVWTCLPYEDTRLVEVYRIEVEPSGVYVSGSHGEKTREYLAVTEGELTVECHGQSYCIHKDQIFKFETDQEHIYKNTGSGKACCTCFSLIIMENRRKHRKVIHVRKKHRNRKGDSI